MAKKKINKLFLILNAGEKAEAAEPKEVKRYIGIAPVNVIAVNPTKAELEELYGYTVNSEPEYAIEIDGRKAQRLEFHVRTTDKFDFTATGRIKFLITDKVVESRDGSKHQVIDDYGESTWVTTEQLNAGQRPDNCRVVGPYHKARQGEADLLHFIKEWLNFALSTSWDKDNRKWVPASQENLKKCEIKLNWDELLKGNIAELKEAVKVYADYAVKVCFGIKTTEDNRHYQEVFNKEFLRNSSTYYNAFTRRINECKQAGMFATTEFSSDLIREWKLEHTVFQNTISDKPIANSDIFGNTVPAPDPENYVGDSNNDLPF